MKKLTALMLTGIMALSATTVASAEEAFKIGFACDDLSTDFAASMAAGVTSKAEELGIEVEIQDANKDANNQASQVENMITNGCQAIIMTPYDLSACGPLCQACEEADIPLIVLNTPLQDGFYYTTAVVTDLQAMSEAKGQAIIDAVGEGGKVYMLMGPLAQEMWSIQANIAKEMFEEAGIEIIDEQTGNNKRDESLVVMENWISTGNEFDAVWCSNDATAIGAGTACEEAGIEAYIIGQGGQVEGCQAILDDVFDWTVYAPGSATGAGGVEAAYKILSGEEVDKTYYLDINYIIAENAEDFM